MLGIKLSVFIVLSSKPTILGCNCLLSHHQQTHCSQLIHSQILFLKIIETFYAETMNNLQKKKIYSEAQGSTKIIEKFQGLNGYSWEPEILH